jgi:ribonucleotide reductase beta subunit family protein with ferritin-like domain
MSEPLLTPTDRLTIRPLDPTYSDIWECYKKQQGSFWIPEEIDLSVDVIHWKTLDPDIKHFLKHILAFFATSDEIVGENLSNRFIQEVKVPEVIKCYNYQLMMEDVHSDVYSLFVEELIPNPQERKEIFNAITTMPVVSDKALWARKWIASDRSFATRVVAFACIEGIFFSGSFCAIDFLSKLNIMPGLRFANEFISRDEAEHTDLACRVYGHIVNKLSYDEIKEIVSDAVKIEQRFVTEALPVDLIGINKDLMCQHIEYCANLLVSDLKYKEVLYPKSMNCPFSFMKIRTLQTKTNFFEAKVSEYRKHGALSSKEDMKFSIDDDF